MISNYFSVWFETMKVRDKNFANLVSAYELEQYFEECWNSSQQAYIESDEAFLKEDIQYLQWDKEELDYDKADLEAEIQTLLSRIVYLEEQLQGQ